MGDQGFTQVNIVYPLDPDRPRLGDEVKLTVTLTRAAGREFFDQLVPLVENVERLTEWLREQRPAPVPLEEPK
jgi:hypothetical protein